MHIQRVLPRPLLILVHYFFIFWFFNIWDGIFLVPFLKLRGWGYRKAIRPVGGSSRITKFLQGNNLFCQLAFKLIERNFVKLNNLFLGLLTMWAIDTGYSRLADTCSRKRIVISKWHIQRKVENRSITMMIHHPGNSDNKQNKRKFGVGRRNTRLWKCCIDGHWIVQSHISHRLYLFTPKIWDLSFVPMNLGKTGAVLSFLSKLKCPSYILFQ